MPPKDPKFEYVRVRTRKDRDKDRDKDNRSDTRSVAESSITTIRDRKHRSSFTSGQRESAETSTQASSAAYQDLPLEQLPALPETEESEGASATTSPLLRTSSNASSTTSRTSPPSFKTPEKLQPYLESEPDVSSTTSTAKPISEFQEWIGPRTDMATPVDDLLDSTTPTPQPKKDPLEFAGSELPKKTSDVGHNRGSQISPPPEVDNQGRSIADTNAMVYSWVGSENAREQYLYPSEMSNPFLPPEKFSNDAPKKIVTALDKVPYRTPAPDPPLRRSSPPKSNNRGQERTDQRPQLRAEHHSLARIGGPSPMHSNPPLTEMSGPQHFPWPMIPAPSPIAMHHTHSNPLPYPAGPPTMEHPAHILHRIGSVLPDIGALMNLYQHTCSILITRDQHIGDLQAQKAAEAEQLNQRIDRLTTEIESLLSRHASQVSRLRGDINRWEHEHGELQDSLHQEKRLRDETQTANANLKSKHEEMKRKHKHRIEEMHSNFSSETDLLVTKHAKEKHDLTEQAKGVENNLTSRIAEMEERHRSDERQHAMLTKRIADIERRHEAEKQDNEHKWQQHLQEIDDEHNRRCQDMERALRTKETALEEECRQYSQAKDGWDKEREMMLGHWDTERNNLEKAAKEKNHALVKKHQKEQEDLQRSMGDALSRQNTEANELISKLEQEMVGLQHSLDRTHDHYKSEIQTAMENFVKEKESYYKTTESVFSRQVGELRDTIQSLQKDKETLSRNRGPSQTRQINEARETIAKLQKENEALRTEKLDERERAQRLAVPDHNNASSRSSTPAPKEDRNKLKRTSGMYGSGTSLKSKVTPSSEQSGKGCEPRRSEESQRSHAKDHHH